MIFSLKAKQLAKLVTQNEEMIPALREELLSLGEHEAKLANLLVLSNNPNCMFCDGSGFNRISFNRIRDGFNYRFIRCEECGGTPKSDLSLVTKLILEEPL